jgi:hypothetical protein
MFPYKELEVALKLDFAQHNGYVHDFGIPISSDMGLDDVRITMLVGASLRSFLRVVEILMLMLKPWRNSLV